MTVYPVGQQLGLFDNGDNPLDTSFGTARRIQLDDTSWVEYVPGRTQGLSPWERSTIMDSPESFDAGVAHQIGRYADAVRVPAGYDQILVSGTPGLTPDGTLPDNITDESMPAWTNVEAILSRAGATLNDIVSVRQWLTRAEDITDYVAVRGTFLKHEVASMLAVVPALVWPSVTVEIEVVAAIPATNR